MDRAEYEALRRRAARRREDRVQATGETDTPYFEGCLPIEVMAERGRETLRFGPLKPVGLTNPHAPGGEAVRRRPAPPRQRARHALQHRRLPDQDEARRADRGVPDDPRPRERRLRPARRHPPQHLPRTRRGCSTAACGCRPTRGCASPARSPASRATSRARRWACSPAGSPPPSASAAASPRRRRRPRWARSSATSPAAPTPQTFQPMNVNFGLFPPLDDGARRPARPARPLQGLHRPRQGRLRRLARARGDPRLSRGPIRPRRDMARTPRIAGKLDGTARAEPSPPAGSQGTLTMTKFTLNGAEASFDAPGRDAVALGHPRHRRPAGHQVRLRRRRSAAPAPSTSTARRSAAA